MALALFTPALVAAGEGIAVPDYAQMRAERAAALTAPDGWFSLVALARLAPGETTVGSAPGNTVVIQHVPAQLLTLRTAGSQVTLQKVSPGVWLGSRLAHASEVISDDESPANALHLNQVQMWAIDRGGERYLRVKDPRANERLHFHGLRWYAPDAAYRVEARWVPYATPQPLKIVNRLGQVTEAKVPGYVEFRIDGRRQTLVPLPEDDGSLFFVFTDRTSLSDTDGGGRFLSASAPGHGLDRPGIVTLDFNEAVNPPCAYSPFATCPQAPRENRLKVAIPAGEKRYE